MTRVRPAPRASSGTPRGHHERVALPWCCKSNAHTVLGGLDSSTMVEFDRRLRVFLGFGA
ncbi:MAG: hypothetical protein R2731_18225 [Nocardioides sp.]